jgi:hypothetical protein
MLENASWSSTQSSNETRVGWTSTIKEEEILTEPKKFETEGETSKEGLVVVTCVDKDGASGRASSLALWSLMIERYSKAHLTKRYDMRTKNVKGQKAEGMNPGLSSSMPHPMGGGGGGGGEPPALQPQPPNDLGEAIDHEYYCMTW